MNRGFIVESYLFKAEYEAEYVEVLGSRLHAD